jgi:hypothetical protein
MTDKALAVSSEADIELEAVASVLEGEIKRCERIFWNGLSSAGAAVAEKKRAWHHDSKF